MLSIDTYKVVSSKSSIKILHSTIKSSEEDSPHLFVQHIIPQKELGKKITHVIFQHGLIEYTKRHTELFEYIANDLEENYVISSLDLVGHGKSGGERAHVSDFEVFTKDWLSFLEHCKSEFYQDREVETIIISHSLGGLIVLNTIFNDEIELPFPIKKTIFCNPCIKPKLEIPSQVTNIANQFLFKSLGKVRIPLIYNGHDLTRDSEKVKEFVEDPLISKAVTINMGLQVLKTCKKLAGLSYFYPYKSLFLISGDDRVVDNDKTKVFLSGIDKNLIKIKLYPGMRHDLLNETCRITVFKEIMDFIKD